MRLVNTAQAILLATGAALVGIAPSAGAQTYPTRAITMVVPFAAGGPTDVLARTVGMAMSKDLGQTVVIENRLGAGGTVAVSAVAKAKPDGYTLLAWNTLPPLLEDYKREVGYKTLKFTPLAAFSRDSAIIAVHLDGSKNFADFVKQAKAQTVNVGTTGQYTITGLQGILMTEDLGLKTNWVTFGGGAESLTSTDTA